MENLSIADAPVTTQVCKSNSTNRLDVAHEGRDVLTSDVGPARLLHEGLGISGFLEAFGQRGIPVQRVWKRIYYK